MVGELAALSPLEREFGGASAQRMLWFAHTGDMLLLPRPPRPEYLDYVTGLTGTDPSSLTIVVPPAGELGSDLLTPDRTADDGFRTLVREQVRHRGIEQVLAVFKDVAVAQLAESIGLRLPGHAFSAQGGDAFVNSKAAFRAIAAGSGAPIAVGLATTQRWQAEQLATELLAAGHSVIVKKEFSGGGQGNEILSPVEGVRAAGTSLSVVLPDAAAVAGYFARRWDWLTVGGRHRVAVERYLTDCDTVYAEYLIGEHGPELSGVGELLMEPVATGQLVPPRSLTAATRQTLVEAGLRVCRAMYAMGYRGYLSTDAVLTPSGEIVLTETNGRISGSTHLHAAIENRLLDAEQRADRVILERFGWAVPSFAGARDRLAEAGLGFDSHSGLGVVLTSDLLPDRTVSYCVLARDLAAVTDVEHRLGTLFTEQLVRAKSTGRER
jgi:hypothetical protein